MAMTVAKVNGLATAVQIVEQGTLVIEGTEFGVFTDGISKVELTIDAVTTELTILGWDADTIVALLPSTIVADPVNHGALKVTDVDGNDETYAEDVDVIVMPTDSVGGNTDELILNLPGRVEVDGRVVGYLADNIEIDPSMEFYDFKPSQSRSVVKRVQTDASCTLQMNLHQYNMDNLALALGITEDYAYKAGASPTKIDFKYIGALKDHFVTIFDKAGKYCYVFPRINIEDPAAITLNPTEGQTIPINAIAMPVMETGVLFSIITLA
jgi:hypothetical protein